MNDETGFKVNNKGLSLVELIVAISIGAIVSGTIAALMTFAIRAYRDESAKVSAQYELQTNVNMIMDTIMGANCIVIQKANTVSPSGRLTEYAAFGKFTSTTHTPEGGAPSKTYEFDGVVFVAGSEYPASSGRFNIYMDRGKWSYSGKETAKDIIEKKVTDMKTDIAAHPVTDNPYLLGEGSTRFRIEPKVLSETPSKTYVNIGSGKYKNPLSIEVELRFEKDATGKVVNRQVKDEALVRNKITVPIYIDGSEYTLDKSK